MFLQKCIWISLKGWAHSKRWGGRGERRVAAAIVLNCRFFSKLPHFRTLAVLRIQIRTIPRLLTGSRINISDPDPINFLNFTIPIKNYFFIELNRTELKRRIRLRKHHLGFTVNKQKCFEKELKQKSRKASKTGRGFYRGREVYWFQRQKIK